VLCEGKLYGRSYLCIRNNFLLLQSRLFIFISIHGHFTVHSPFSSLNFYFCYDSFTQLKEAGRSIKCSSVIVLSCTCSDTSVFRQTNSVSSQVSYCLFRYAAKVRPRTKAKHRSSVAHHFSDLQRKLGSR